MEQDQQYLEAIVGPLVEQPFSVDRTTDERGVLLSLNLAKPDMGKIIGKEGETARSIRRLLRQFGAGQGAHVSVKINEPNEQAE